MKKQKDPKDTNTKSVEINTKSKKDSFKNNKKNLLYSNDLRKKIDQEKENKKLVLKDNLENNMFSKKKVLTKQKKSLIGKRLSIALACCFGNIGILSAIYFPVQNFSTSFVSTNVEQTTEEKKAIADQLALLNKTTSINSSTLSNLFPEEVLSSQLTFNTVRISLGTLTKIEEQEITFEIILDTADDIMGSIEAKLFYKQVEAQGTIEIFGFKKRSKINIEQQPISTSIQEGLTANFNIVATIYKPSAGEVLSYQWYFNGSLLVDSANKISGATTNALTIENASQADKGTYQCKVTIGSLYSVDSNIVNLTVQTTSSIVLNQILELNKNIDIKDATLTGKLPSQINLSDLTLARVPFNTASIVGFVQSKLSITSFVNPNDNLGTLEIYITYDGIQGLSPIKLSGFKTLPNITIVSISKTSNADTILQPFVNSLKNDPLTTTPNYSQCFTITLFSTGASVPYNTAVRSVTYTTTKLADGNIQVKFFINLNTNYGTNSVTNFTYTSNT